jgi:hypothetical protein
MFRDPLKQRSILFFLTCFYCLLATSSFLADEYIDSAHGSSSKFILRLTIGYARPAEFDYSLEKFVHYHLQHAIIEGNEPLPDNGRVSSHKLFAHNFNTAQSTIPYSKSNNFCFYYHNYFTSTQTVLNNNDYSQNPHLAMTNWTTTQDPSYSAISKPTDDIALWETDKTMDINYNTQYGPPDCYNSLTNREPCSSSSGTDFIISCLDCNKTHSSVSIMILRRLDNDSVLMPSPLS